MAASFSISLFTAVLTGAFALIVFQRFRQSKKKHRKHLLAWAIGLTFYSLSMLAQAALFYGWNGWLFKLWYWAGALAVAPWLGQGTAFLLIRKPRRAWLSFWFVMILSLAGLLLVVPAGLNSAGFRAGLDLTEQYKEIFAMSGALITARTILAIVMNSYGTLLLVGGAAYSAWIFWRKSILPRRMMGNILIAAGGLLPALAGTLILFERPEFKYLGQTLGGILLFGGFLLASSAQPAARTQRHALSGSQSGRSS